MKFQTVKQGVLLFVAGLLIIYFSSNSFARGLHFGIISAVKEKVKELEKKNDPPTIFSLTANPTTVAPSSTSTITCIALDPNGDTLIYSWSATGGTILGSGYQVTWIAPSTVGTHVITCTVSDGKGGTAQQNVNVVVIKLAENTKILSGETVDRLVKQYDSTYYFDIQAVEIENLKTGDIIISTEDEGFLRKVTNVTVTSSEYVLQTTTATLEEAFEDADIELEKDLSPTDLNPQEAPLLKKGISVYKTLVPGEFYFKLENLVLYDDDENLETKHDQVVVDGVITFTPGIEFKLKTSMFTLQELKFIMIGKAKQNIKLKSTLTSFELLNKKIEIGKLYFSPIVLGPIVFTTEISVVVGLKAKAGLELDLANVTLTESFTGGVMYNNKTWSPIGEFSVDFEYGIPYVSLAGDIKAFLGPELALKLYGLVGPYMETYGYVSAEAEYPLLPLKNALDWRLYGGVEARSGVEIEVFTVKLADFEAPELFGWRIILASGTVVSETTPVAPSNLFATVVSSSHINLSWQDNSNNEAGFKVERSIITGQTYSQIATVGTNVTSYNDTGLTPSTTYFYRVKAYNSAGDSGYSNEASTTTLSTPSVTVSGEWKIQTVDSASWVGVWTSIALDTNDYPHISYFDDTNKHLKYAKWTGSSWVFQTVDYAGDVGGYTSITLDSSGHPHISYCDWTNGDLKYARWRPEKNVSNSALNLGANRETK